MIVKVMPDKVIEKLRVMQSKVMQQGSLVPSSSRIALHSFVSSVNLDRILSSILLMKSTNNSSPLAQALSHVALHLARSSR